ncbi:MAG: AMP-binding protein [Polyangiaceae bacterium]|jgi:fatty-acyl-CoA synthase
MPLPDFLEAAGVAKDREHVWRFPAQHIELSLGAIVTAGAEYAAALASLRVGAGDRVGLMLENCAEYTSLLLGIWTLGAIAVPLRPYGGQKFDLAGFIREVDHDCEFAVLVVEDEFDAGIRDAWVAASGRCAMGKGRLSELAKSAPAVRATPLAREDMAILQYSSGSTSRPKGVIVSHGMVGDQVRQLDAEFRHACVGAGLRSSGSWLPFYHDMGLFIGLLYPLFARAHNILASPLFYMRDPKRWFRLQAAHRVDWNFTTNLAMANSVRSLRLLDPAAVDLSHFHLYLAAEKVSPVVLEQTCDVLARLGTPRENVRVGYGMAENALGVASTKDGAVRCVRVRLDSEAGLRFAEADDPEAVEIVSIGRPHVNTIVTVRDEQGNVRPDFTLGEICVEGPCVTPGYFRDSAKTLQHIVGGVLRTGDIGFRLDGEFYFVTRKDDVLVVGGRNVSPEDIEDCVEAVDGVPVGGAVLIDVPVVETGTTELVLLVEVYHPLSPEQAAERSAMLRAHVLDQRGLLVNRVVFAKKNALEKTSSGKKRRVIIRKRFVKHELDLI